jgi:hypothetical protein
MARASQAQRSSSCARAPLYDCWCWWATDRGNRSDKWEGEDRARDSGNETANGTRNEDGCTGEVEDAVQQARREQCHAEQPDHHDQRDAQQRRWTCAEQHQEERREECGALAD